MMRRYIVSRQLALLLLALLLTSASLARSSTGYDLALWSMAGGGATFGAAGSYSLGGTIGQPSAGQSSGGPYTLGSGFWGGGAAKQPRPPGPIFVPIAALFRAPPPALCDRYEPNNNRYVDATLLTSTDAVTAKICSNDIEARHPEFNFEDNYTFVTTSAAPIQIILRLPKNLWRHVAIGVYANSALSSRLPGVGCYNEGFSDIPLVRSCSIPAAGRYTVRIYSSDGTVENTDSYQLQVIFQ